MRSSPVSPDAFKHALSRLASGVTVVAAQHGGRRHGLTASSFTSVSLSPPLVLVCAARRLETLAAIEASGAFGVSVLGTHQRDLGLRFAGLLGETRDCFEGVDTETAVTGSPLLPGSLARLDCRVWRVYDGGDHVIVVGEVVDAAVDDNAAPLLYGDRRWHGLATIDADPPEVGPGLEDGPAERRPSAAPLRDLDDLLRRLDPLLSPEEFVYVALKRGVPPGVTAPAAFVEPEGRSAILARGQADRLGLAYRDVFRMITLAVASDLMAVGLTAAVSRRLAEAGIPCNVVAALHHDHLLVPAAAAERALEELRSLQAQQA